MASYSANVKRYLLDNYDVDTQTVDAALATAEVQADLAKYERERSFPYYAGDQVAAGHGWPDVAELADDAYDGCPEDEED